MSYRNHLFIIVLSVLSMAATAASAQQVPVAQGEKEAPYAPEAPPSPPAGVAAADGEDPDAAEDPPNWVFAEIGFITASGPLDRVLWEVAGTAGYRMQYLEFSLALAGSSTTLLTGSRSAFSMAPRIGAHLSYGSDTTFFQPFAALQLPIQFRSGGNLADDQGVALAGDVGVRVVGCPDDFIPGFCIGGSAAMRVQYHITDYLVGALLPQGSALVSFPLTFILGIAL